MFLQSCQRLGKSQGKSLDGGKSGSFVMNAHNNFIAVDTFLFHILVAHMDPGLENPCIFLMLYDVFPP